MRFLTVSLALGLLLPSLFASGEVRAAPHSEVAEGASPLPHARMKMKRQKKRRPKAAKKDRLASSAKPATPRRRKRSRAAQGELPAFDWEARTHSAIGYFQGRTYRQLPGAVLDVGAELQATYRARWFLVHSPIVVEHSQPTVPLAQSKGRTGLELTALLSPLFRPSAGYFVSGTLRPDWPDYYQPRSALLNPTDRLPTSRYSFWDRSAEGEVSSNLGRGHHVRLKYRYRVRQFLQDPNFDAWLHPMHLTPGDTTEHRLGALHRYIWRGNNVAWGASVYQRDYLFRFSRDAVTGASHAGPGGMPPNPLQRFIGVVPELGFKWKLSKALFVRTEASLAYNLDTYADYYTAWEPGASIHLEWDPSRSVRVLADLGARWRRYTPSGYGLSEPQHPALDYGEVRQDDRYTATLDSRFRLGRGWFLHAAVSGVIRETNFPDYVPLEHPLGKNYSIDWDYTNLTTFLSLNYRIH